MDNYYKYLPISTRDIDWGMYLLNVGSTRIQPDDRYPYITHPSHHYFSWDRGRILQEFQLIHIPNGSGTFESSSAGKIKIEEGALIMLFPGEEHRYRPDEKTGWDEYWIGFNGTIIDHLLDKGFLTKESPVMKLGFSDKILGLFLEIISATKTERPGYQAYVSGIILHLLGFIHSLSKQEHIEGNNMHHVMVDKARSMFRSNLLNNISPEEVASQLNISYSYFRRIFRQYAGLSPGQYQLQLKIQMAKEYLVSTEKTIKEVCYELGFESTTYFSAIFRKKTGMAPSQFKVACRS